MSDTNTTPVPVAPPSPAESQPKTVDSDAFWDGLFNGLVTHCQRINSALQPAMTQSAINFAETTNVAHRDNYHKCKAKLATVRAIMQVLLDDQFVSEATKNAIKNNFNIGQPAKS